MDNTSNNELISQLEENLKCSELNWLLGAGISYDAKLPLMYPLTNRVSNRLKINNIEAFNNCLVPLKAGRDRERFLSKNEPDLTI